MTTKVKVEFLGGLNIVLAPPHPKQITVLVPNPSDSQPPTVKDLIDQISTTLIPEQKDVDVFLENGTIRPGILTLINDADWELEGEESYELENGDVISFTSTLHGG